MESWRRWLKSRDTRCAAWIALCFALTSAVYLSWVYRLVALTGSTLTDWLSMVAGYLVQAAGIGIAVAMLRRSPGCGLRRRFAPAALLFAAVSVPALLGGSPAPVIAFGLLMNLLCGIIAGFYVHAIGTVADPARWGRVFGGGYAVATVAVGLLALVGNGMLIRGRAALPVCLALCAVTILTAERLPASDAGGEALQPREADGPAGEILPLACAVTIMISLVKNLGFGFPSSDIEAGLMPELSRIAYAVGLAAAGRINDRSRRNGMIFTVAALIIPFIMLGLTSEPVPSAICWGLDYLFFGFFSVFRVVLFLDIAARMRRWQLAPLGLLLGRLGDAAGTGLSILLSDRKLGLIITATALFFPTVFLFFRLYQKLFEAKTARQRSEQEVFEAFCLHNDLSSREREVLRMVLSDSTNGEIAGALFITESTVKYHVRNILQKTGCKNRGELQKIYTMALYPHIQPAGKPE